jgi:hypothetical protein
MNTNRIIAGCCAFLLSLSSHASAAFVGRAPVKGAPTSSPAPQTGPADSNPATGNDSGSSKPPQTNTDGKIPGSSSSDTQPVPKPPESVTQGDSGASPTNPISPPSPQPAPTPQPSPNEGSNQGTGNAGAAGGQTDPVSSSCTEIPLTYCTHPVQGAPPSQSPYANYGLGWCKCILELVNNQIKNGGASCAEVDKWFTLFAEMKDEPGSRCQHFLPGPDPWLNGFVSCWFEPICAGRSNTTDQSGFALGAMEDSQGKGCCDPHGCLGAFKSHGRSQQAWINATRPDPDSPPACSSEDEEYFPFLSNGSCHDCGGCFKDFNPGHGHWSKISNFVEKGPLSCGSFGFPTQKFSNDSSSNGATP